MWKSQRDPGGGKHRGVSMLEMQLLNIQAQPRTCIGRSTMKL